MTPVPVSQRSRSFTLGAAAYLATCSVGALAADTTWTGAAGLPFWDLASNWSAGPPDSLDTRALLGSSDTTIRHGAFLAGQVTGQGRLRLAGGSLQLQGPGSTLGHLDLHGGTLGGEAEITVGSLDWRAGGFTSADGRHRTLQVSGAATLSGTLHVGIDTSLELNGTSLWKDGPSSLEGGPFALTIGARGRFHDHAASGDHVLRLGLGRLDDFRIDGQYLKTGGATTTWDTGIGSPVHRGRLDVQGGRLNVELDNQYFENAGVTRIENAAMSIRGHQGGLSNSGTFDVQAGGSLTFAADESGVGSTGVWTIAKGGRVELQDAARHGAPVGYIASTFTSGAIRNEGTLVFRGARYFDGGGPTGVFILGRDLAISGGGSIEAAAGVELQIERDLHVGRLRIGEPAPYDPLEPRDYVFSRVVAAGTVVVDELDWEDGFLDPTGDVTVLNAARLSNDWSSYWNNPQMRRLGKEINTAFTFQRRAEWDGNGDLFGTGNIRVAIGARFEDHNSQGTLDFAWGQRLPRPTRIEVASFINDGRYVKTGAGITVVQSRFDNRGTVQVVDAAPLVFAGTLNNTGTLEAVRSRVTMAGTLSQLQGGVLTEGRYIARNGTLVFAGVDEPGATRPMGIVRNEATLVLDGPHARLSTIWLGLEQDALARLSMSTGRLEVLNGATLTTLTGLANRGVLVVAGGGEVQAEGFWQPYDLEHSIPVEGPTPVTWLDGTLKGRAVSFDEGDLGPGTRGGIGVANLIGKTSFSKDSRLLLDIRDEQAFDQVRITGSVALNGILRVDVGGAEPTLGSFRVLTATEGLEGRFTAVASGLDPAQYRISASYMPNYLELTVTPAPEPGTWSLGLLGGALLAARRRGSKP
ncbi:hypothetical protein OOT46_03585 [Aquabacterium sp. A7-Y]|uniref:PEP-CTERM sorting domain-containing protein n=1 Tax=Aquabacterium sp. A7-Y TaxID=1349605 RepID=UPI00223D91FC|nr:PEP-CTERM sorting domain-containing protein [Aquabacterium sp. A7-Y]MCW7536934.1 hypothetical protein [Aquabacterium sp. A7-Y]